MQPPRHSKPRLLSLSVIITLVPIITTFAVISAVNRSLVIQSSADTNNNKSTATVMILRTSANYNDNSRNNNRKVSLEPPNTTITPYSSFWVVQKAKMKD